MNSRPSPRFAVLEHSWNGVHWDLLLETVPEEPLRTWAIDAPIVFDVELLARSSADHCAIYLDYEGPIADGRGSVRRVDYGVYESIQWTDDHIKIRIKGTQLEGLIDLRRIAESSSWSFRLGKVD